MKKKIIGILLVCAFLILVFAIKGSEEKMVFSEEYIMAEELPALLSFTHYGLEEWQEKIAEKARGKLDYQELEDILDGLGIKEYITYEAKTGLTKVTRTEFFEIYAQLVDLLDVEGKVKKMNLLFLKEKEKEGLWITQKGEKQVAGGENYIKNYDAYQAYTYNGAVIGLTGKAEEPVLWKNIFIHSTAHEKAQIIYEQELLTIDIAALKEEISDTICDVEWKNGTITAIYKKEEMISGTVLSYNKKHIEISGYGKLKYQGKLKIYKTYGTVEQLDETKLMIGNLMADFVVAQGKVCGIILREPAEIQQIRVLLLNGETPYHSEVYLKSDQELSVTFGKKEEKIAANTIIKASDYWKKNSEKYLKLVPQTKEGTIFRTDAQGNPVSLGYQGSFEIRKYLEGYGIVNELSLEDYLCGVVPSEMPASYEKEALRAQAVCARSYACIQLMKSEYADFGANVDDSTNYQVYNKQERSEATTLAVRDTVGEVLQYQGKIAEAYYYSTSCGYSQSMEVWNIENESAYGYLQNTSLLTKKKKVDFSQEKSFAKFIKDNDCSAYDSDCAYFRWQAEVDTSAYTQQINQTISSRRNVNPDYVLCFDNEGNLSEKNPEDMGKILQLTPEERSGGGVLKSLRIQYENGSVLLKTEYNIRKVLGVAVTVLQDKNDKNIEGMTLLPSAAFVAIPIKNGYVLYGGGYGHGIGMSQNGANGMAKAGYKYMDILQKFYQNIQIENIYNGK